MSLDLTLLPFDHDSPQLSYSHTLLQCVTNCNNLFEEIEKESSKEIPKSIDYVNKVATGVNKDCGEVPKNFTCYLSRIPNGSMKDEHCYGEVNSDPYGKPLRYLTVRILLKFKNHPEVLRNQRHLAIWAYLEHLDPNTKVALFWH